MTNQDKLEGAFNDVRKIFFPRWDRQKKWSVELIPDLPSPGRCEIGIKKIILKLIPEDDDELKLILIHEICHALIPNHKKRWRDRLRIAAAKAKSIVETALSNKIWNEILDYKKREQTQRIYYAEDIYARIEEMLTDCPDASFDSVISYLAQEFGHYKEEFLKMYTKCEQVYEDVKKNIRRQKRLRAQVEKLIKKNSVTQKAPEIKTPGSDRDPT